MEVYMALNGSDRTEVRCNVFLQNVMCYMLFKLGKKQKHGSGKLKTIKKLSINASNIK